MVFGPFFNHFCLFLNWVIHLFIIELFFICFRKKFFVYFYILHKWQREGDKIEFLCHFVHLSFQEAERTYQTKIHFIFYMEM